MRTKVIAANWKMNCGTPAEATGLVTGLLAALDEHALDKAVEVVICPPYTVLTTVAALLDSTELMLGGQDMFWKESGAYTGQISPKMLVEIGCSYVIVGHSEPRGRFGVPEPDFDEEILAYFGDSNAAINRKVLAAVACGLTPILCVGETLPERQQNDTDSVVSGQLMLCMNGLSMEQASSMVVAYEPVWAIGTGQVCDACEADRVCGIIREGVGKLYGARAAQAVRVVYGGSVKPDNAVDLLARTNIDGALVGGASLKAADFAGIVSAA